MLNQRILPSRKAKIWILLLNVFLIGAIGYVDFLVKDRISVSIFYLVPVLFITKIAGLFWGLTAVLSSTLLWLTADLSSGYPDIYSAFPYWNALIRAGFFFAVVFLFGNWQNEYSYARRDPLTEVLNRRAFLEELEKEAKRSRRYRHFLSLIFFDIDNFKQINDRFGHSKGDAFLAAFGQWAQKSVRETDTVSRIGGDEFVILMPETNGEQVVYVAERLKRDLEKKAEGLYSVTLSMGIVTFEKPPEQYQQIIEAADTLMYRAKKNGKAQIVYQVFK